LGIAGQFNILAVATASGLRTPGCGFVPDVPGVRAVFTLSRNPRTPRMHTTCEF
jgi:hypothetical protein